MEKIISQKVGEEGITALVAAFYKRVREDDLLAPMYPAHDWRGAESRLRDFLLFRFGMSEQYVKERGHPRLRMRHLPFSIGSTESQRWQQLMGEAMDEIEIDSEAKELLSAFFAQVADFMRNRPD
jgi:hemoglobin